MEYLKAEHVSFFHDAVEGGEQAQQVLRGVSMKIRKGEFVVLLGHNGSGKSIMVKHFNAMLLSSGGRVYVDGMGTTNENLKHEIRRRVGLVLQSPDNQLMASTAEEGVAFEPENLGISPAEIRQRVDAALEVVGMLEYASHSVHELSGEQRQRVVITGIIAIQPDCIVLDEPTVMLDPRGRIEVMETIHRLNHGRGTTVVLVTHYMDEAVQANRAIVMDSGEILLEDAPREVFSHVGLLRQHSLDVPQATELLYRLDKVGCTVLESILNGEECAVALGLLLNE